MSFSICSGFGAVVGECGVADATPTAAIDAFILSLLKSSTIDKLNKLKMFNYLKLTNIFQNSFNYFKFKNVLCLFLISLTRYTNILFNFFF